MVIWAKERAQTLPLWLLQQHPEWDFQKSIHVRLFLDFKRFVCQVLSIQKCSYIDTK